MDIVLIRGDGSDPGRRRVQQLGNLVVVTDVDGAIDTRSCFDPALARARAEAIVDGWRAEGWVDAPEMRSRREAAAARSATLAAATDHLAAIAAAADLPRALAADLASVFDLRGIDPDLLPRVTARARSMTVSDDGGCTIHFDHACRLIGSGPLEAAALARAPPPTRRLFGRHGYWWFFDDAGDQHRIHVGIDAGPPEGDAELDRTELSGRSGLTWLMEVWPHDTFWLMDGGLGPSGRPWLRPYAFDGGLGSARDVAVEGVMLEGIAEILDDAW